jgi:hypothetical protein
MYIYHRQCTRRVDNKPLIELVSNSKLKLSELLREYHMYGINERCEDARDSGGDSLMVGLVVGSEASFARYEHPYMAPWPCPLCAGNPYVHVVTKRAVA